MRIVFAFAALALAVPAQAAELAPQQAKEFVAGKLFSYTCFEGTRGMGRINADGSVAGTVQMRGTGMVHHVALPAGTVQVGSTAVCASMRGVPFSPCFNVNQTDNQSFRGSVSGFGFAYCDFVKRGPRMQINTVAMRSARSLAPPQVRAVQAAEVTAAPEPQLRTRTFTTE